MLLEISRAEMKGFDREKSGDVVGTVVVMYDNEAKPNHGVIKVTGNLLCPCNVS